MSKSELNDPEQTDSASAFSGFLRRHEDLARDYAEGRGASSERMVELIKCGISASKNTPYLEERRRLRMLLRLWAARLCRRGFEYPEIDIDTPVRRPAQVLTKEVPRQDRATAIRKSSLPEVAGIVEGMHQISVGDLSRLEGSIPDLKVVFVVSHYVERPRGDLQEAVELNFERGVKYRFLISPSSYREAGGAYFEIFRSLAAVVVKRHRSRVAVEEMVSIRSLAHEWSEYPFVFYQYGTSEKIKSTFALHGDQKQEGLAASYVPVDPVAARALLTAVLHSSPIDLGAGLSESEVIGGAKVLDFLKEGRS